LQQLIIKKDIGKIKMDALLNFLKSWDIDAELITKPETKKQSESDFSLSFGIWKDYEISGTELRSQAWKRK
jgi:hypothetical protein